MNRQPLLIEDAFDFGSPPPKSIEAPWEKLYRFFFGDDVFISYSRADAIRYVPSLAARLAAKGHICFFDQLAADPSEALPKRLKKKILRSTVFVLIGTRGAVASSFVRKEVELFRRTRRPFIPVDVDGALVEQDGWREVVGLAKIHEEGVRVRDGDPSPDVVNLIKDSFRYMRRSQWLRASLLTGVSVVFITAIVSLLVIRAAQTEGATIKRQAESDVATANKRVGEAEVNLGRITAQADALEVLANDAKNQAASANEARNLAVEQQEAAEEDKRRAQELERHAVEHADDATRQEQGSRAAVLSRVPGMEFDALALAVEAAERSGHKRLLSEQVTRGLTTSAAVTDYSLPLDGSAGDVVFTEISPSGEKIFGEVYDHRSASYKWVLWDGRTGKSSAFMHRTGKVHWASFSRDGNRLVVMRLMGENLPDEILSVWDLTGPQARALKTECTADSRHVSHVALDGDGNQLATITSFINPPQTIVVCELATGRKETLVAPYFIYSVAFTPEDEPVVRGDTREADSKDPKDVLYFARSNRTVETKTSGGRLEGFGDDGSIIMSASGEADAGSSERVEIQSAGGDVRTYSGYRGEVSSAAFSDRRLRVVTISGGRARVADTQFVPDFAALRAHRRPLDAVTFSPNDKLVVTLSTDGTARLWNVATSSLIHTLLVSERLPGKDSSEYLYSKRVAFAPDSTRLVTYDKDSGVQTWDTQTGRPVCPVPDQKQADRATLTLENLSNFPWGKRSVGPFALAVSFLSGSDYVMVAHSRFLWRGNRNSISFFDARKCEVVGEFSLPEGDSFEAFSPDGTSMISMTRGDSPEVRLWNLREIKLPGADSRGRYPVQLNLTSASLGAPPGDVPRFNFGVRHSFSFTGGLKVLSSSQRNALRIWEPGVGSASVRLEGSRGTFGLTFSADGTRAAAITGTEVRVWEARSGKLLVAFDCDLCARAKEHLSLSSDGSKLLIAGSDHVARIYPTSPEAFLRAARHLLGR